MCVKDPHPWHACLLRKGVDLSQVAFRGSAREAEGHTSDLARSNRQCDLKFLSHY